jgi:hypothetical protein
MYKLEDGTKVNSIPVNYTGIADDTYGTKEWYRYGKYHRLDGPAVEEADGSQWWYQYGKLHRLEGPAWEMADGSKEWWISDNQITKASKLILVCSN